jgi:hypothetical protein
LSTLIGMAEHTSPISQASSAGNRQGYAGLQYLRRAYDDL